ncbi:MAG: CHAT domain-containing protein, partial [Cyanobacteria bacterium P01_A01_bin.135]
DQQRQVTRQFVEFTRRPDVAERVRQLSQTTRDRSLPLASLRQLSNNLAQLGPGTALLYPLVLEDRVELILVTADSPPVRRTVAVGRVAINQAIAQFRSALEDPSSEAQAPAQQLYDWLVRPLENDLSQAQVQNLLYAPDDQLRYIPLAALHDGEGWLVERLRTSSITAASLTDFTASPQPELRLLAGAFTQGEYQVKAGDRRLSFGGLPFAGQEVRALSALVPEATAVFDQAFNRAAVEPQLNSYTAVHLATHAAFLPGQPDESFILLGDGDRITLRDVELEWFLTNVDLVVLSACETGVGGFGSGEEILGFGYLMQDAGARAAIASLWAVSDGGTQALMTHFYRALLTEGMTKAEALRQAQVALITGQHQAEADGDRGVSLRPRSPDAGPVASDLSHPYYWAPFILIGNGL